MSQVWKFQFGAATQSQVIGLFIQLSKALLSTYLLGAGALKASQRLRHIATSGAEMRGQA